MNGTFQAHRKESLGQRWAGADACVHDPNAQLASSPPAGAHPAANAVPAHSLTGVGSLARGALEKLRKLAGVRVLRYAAVGAGAALLQLALLAVFVEVFHIAALLASTAALSISVLVNYRLQHLLTFRSKSAHLIAGPRFIGLTLGTLVANAGLFSLISLVLPYLLSQIITTLTIFPINYFLNKTFTFRT
jgi:putative flippase GtrA